MTVYEIHLIPDPAAGRGSHVSIVHAKRPIDISGVRYVYGPDGKRCKEIAELRVCNS